MEKNSEKITKIKTIIKIEIKNFSSEKDDWKKIVKNDITIALNVLYAKKKK